MALPLLARLAALGKSVGQLGKVAGRSGLNYGKAGMSNLGKTIGNTKMYQNYPNLTKVGGAALGAGALGAGLSSDDTLDNNDIDWVETTYDGKTYEFANTPYVHQIMAHNGPLHMKETVDQLVEVGLMRLIEDDSNPFTQDLPRGNQMTPEDFR